MSRRVVKPAGVRYAERRRSPSVLSALFSPLGTGSGRQARSYGEHRAPRGSRPAGSRRPRTYGLWS